MNEVRFSLQAKSRLHYDHECTANFYDENFPVDSLYYIISIILSDPFDSCLLSK